MELKRYHLLIAPLVLLILWFAVLAASGAAGSGIAFLGRLGSAILFAISCAGIGRFLVRSEADPIARWILSFSTGLIVYYYLIFALGLLHAYSAPLLVILAYIPAAGLLLRIKPADVLRGLTTRIQVGRAEAALMLTCVAVGFYSFVVSLTPVTHYDALANHFGIAAEYLVRGGIEQIPYNLHANLPPGAHMILLPLLAGAGGDAAQTFQFLLLLLLLPAFRCIAGSATPAWLIGWLLFASIPQVSLLLSLANIDFLTTFYCVVCYLLCARILEERGEGREVRIAPVLLSAHLAFLFSLKYQAALFVGLMLLVLTARRPAIALRILIGAAVLCAPFLIKNFLFTGDPVFPFATGSFPVSATDRAEAELFVAANSHMPEHPRVMDFAVTFLRCFTRLPESGVLALVALLVVFSLPGLEFRHKYLLALFSVVPVGMHVLLSLNVVNVMRWIQYSWAFLCLLGGVCVAAHARRSVVAYAGLAVCLLVAFYFSFTLNYRLTRSFLVGIGKISPADYRAMYVPSFDLRTKLKGLPGRVLFLGESRGYYNVENSVIPSDYDFLYLRRYFDSATTVQELRRSFLQDGIRYLYVNAPGLTSNLKDRLSWMSGAKLKLLQDLMRDSSPVARDRASWIVQLRPD